MLFLCRLWTLSTQASPHLKQSRQLLHPRQLSTIMAPKRKLGTDPRQRTSKRAATTAVNLVVNGEASGNMDPAKKPTRKNAVAEDAPASAKDVEMNGLEESDIEDEQNVQMSMSRPPPVNSGVLPLPWKGRLGYACLNTYLRTSNPPVFNSRTCRIASILEHRHPLCDPSQPEHPIKNRPDREKPPDSRLGQRWVENLGLANAKDIIKMIRWNDRYGIKFLRLSSEMFPFASHEEYGYSLAPFASETLAAAGKVIADLGHRVSTHPGQFTQLGSPRSSVVEASVRDLAYHDELLSLLKLPEQQDRDAVMILHMGGVFGSKPETFDRFRANYARLSDSIKRRLVLENDDMSYSVHDLLPLCQELNIPLVLDFHHHNIIFDSSAVREGTADLIPLFPQIAETWRRKGITQKMHYSEATPSATTRMQRRKHSARVASLPPCAADMDLMIEAKDKEQAVFELMRNFRLPGFDRFSDVVPHVRPDENKVIAAGRKKKGDAGEGETKAPLVPEEEIGMGGPEGRVYWPPGMEEWLRPKKRVVKAKGGIAEMEAPTKTEAGADVLVAEQPKVKKSKKIKTESIEAVSMPVVKKSKAARKKRSATEYSDDENDDEVMDLEPAQTKPSTRRTSNRSHRKSYAEVDVSD